MAASSIFLANSLLPAQRSICRDSRRPIGARQTRIVSAKVTKQSSARGFSAATPAASPASDSQKSSHSSAASPSDSASSRGDSSGPLTPLPYPETGIISGDLLYILTTAVAVPYMLWSMYTVKTTGCKLPSPPGGFIGTLEVWSAFHVQFVVALGLRSRFKTGFGLGPGPYGLLRVAEWASYACYAITVLIYLDKFISTGTMFGKECFPYAAS